MSKTLKDYESPTLSYASLSLYSDVLLAASHIETETEITSSAAAALGINSASGIENTELDSGTVTLTW